MIRVSVGFLLVASVYSAALKYDAESMVPEAPTPSKCMVPWPAHGRWTDCTPETKINEGSTCNFEHHFGYKCTYEDGPLPCDKRGNFEKDAKGPNICNVIPFPENGKGCAIYDFDDEACRTMEGCKWSATNSWCEIVCRTTGCGVELHRRDDACFFNCPFHNATACAPWQAGCSCIQDTEITDCEEWCRDTNENMFVWLPKASTASESYKNSPDDIASNNLNKKFSKQMTVAASFLHLNDYGSSVHQMCKDACFQRGVCDSPKVVP